MWCTRGEQRWEPQTHGLPGGGWGGGGDEEIKWLERAPGGWANVKTQGQGCKGQADRREEPTIHHRPDLSVLTKSWERRVEETPRTRRKLTWRQ